MSSNLKFQFALYKITIILLEMYVIAKKTTKNHVMRKKKKKKKIPIRRRNKRTSKCFSGHILKTFLSFNFNFSKNNLINK